MVPDGDPVAAAVRSAVADGVDVVMTTGGTGISPTDRTPEATRLGAGLRGARPRRRDPGRRAAQGAHRRAVPGRGRRGRHDADGEPARLDRRREGRARRAGRVLDHAVDQLAGGDHVPARSRHRLLAPAAVVCGPRSAETPALRRPSTPPWSPTRPPAPWSPSPGVVRDHDHGRGVTRAGVPGHPSAKERHRRGRRRDRRAGTRRAGAGRQPPARPAGHRRRGTGLRGVRRAPRARPSSPARELVDEVKAQAAGLEAPGVRRRHRRMGQLPRSSR